MKRTIVPLKVFISALISYGALYSFLKTSIYTALVEKFGSLMEMLGATSYTESTLTLTLIGLIALLVLLVIVFSGSEYVDFLFTVSFLLFVPSVLPASETNWLSLVDIAIKSRISPYETLGLGIIIVTGSALLVEITRIGEMSSNLVERGASEESVEKVVKKKMMYAFSLVALSGGLSVLVIPTASFLIPKFQGFFSGLPLPHVFVGVGTAIVISLTILFFLVSRGVSFSDE